MSIDHIVVRGAREHNLKGIDVTIPRNKLVVITGSLRLRKVLPRLRHDLRGGTAALRRESLSAYARQFLEQMEKPDVDAIEGLSPAISIEQKTTIRNPRSTVGTVTEIYDYLRLLFARVGEPHCYRCNRRIAGQTVPQIVDQVMAWPEGTRIHVMAPVIRSRKGEYRKEMRDWQKAGFVRARIDGELIELADALGLDKNRKHDLDVLVDRLTIKDAIRSRLHDSIEQALKLADRIARVEIVRPDGEVETSHLFSEKFACIECGVSYPEIAPRMFSFNNPHGACPECGGLGSKATFDPERVVPDPRLSLRAGAVEPWREKDSVFHRQALQALARHYKFELDTPWSKLPKQAREVILHGSGDTELLFAYESAGKKHRYRQVFEGVIPELERRRASAGEVQREELEGWMSARTCEACGGARLRVEARFVKIANRNIAELTSMSVRQAYETFSGLELDPMRMEIARRILKEIVERLGFMMNVGLEYLTLDRAAATLSGGRGAAHPPGHADRIEPRGRSVHPGRALHRPAPARQRRLLATLEQLRDLGNTVLVVEHDEATILAADHVIDMGPGAGVRGGDIVAEGTPEAIQENPDSLTGLYLSGKRAIPVPEKRRKGDGRDLADHGREGGTTCGTSPFASPSESSPA